MVLKGNTECTEFKSDVRMFVALCVTYAGLWAISKGVATSYVNMEADEPEPVYSETNQSSSLTGQVLSGNQSMSYSIGGDNVQQPKDACVGIFF